MLYYRIDLVSLHLVCKFLSRFREREVSQKFNRVTVWRYHTDVFAGLHPMGLPRRDIINGKFPHLYKAVDRVDDLDFWIGIRALEFFRVVKRFVFIIFPDRIPVALFLCRFFNKRYVQIFACGIISSSLAFLASS
jgi:hypothetical protein